MKAVNHNFLDGTILPIIHQTGNLVTIKFPLMKQVPAHYAIKYLLHSGKIDNEKEVTLVDTSSGTFALGLAMECMRYKFKCIIVGDHAIDKILKLKIESLGAKVVIVEDIYREGYQKVRLRKLQEIINDDPNALWVKQYDNPACRKAYLAIAALLVQEISCIDMLVAPVGSGSSSCGISEGLRHLWPNMKLVGVDTPNSVLFGCPNGPRRLRGLGNTIMPENLLHNFFDEVHWVPAAEAYTMTHYMYSKLGADVGPTSGASYLVASSIANLNPDKQVAYLCPDSGERYRSMVLDSEALRTNGLWATHLPTEPHWVDDPRQVTEQWCAIKWGRRELLDVLSLKHSDVTQGGLNQ